MVLGLDENATGTVWFDDIQLEKSEGESSFNLIENSGLTNGTANWSPEAGLSNCIDLNEFDKCMYINGDVTQQLVGLVQQIYNVSGKKGDVFSFGSWAKANSAPTDNQTKLGDSYQPAFQLALHYYDASGRWIQCTTTKANCDVGTWQFLSAKSIAPIDYSKIAIEIIYSHNINVLYGTGGYCYKEEYGQTYDYDKDGNVISTKDLAKTQSEFAYYGNQMAKMFNPSGSKYMYTYDEKNKLTNALSTDGQEYDFQYDDKGNVTQSDISALKPTTSIEPGKTYVIINSYSGQAIDSHWKYGELTTTYRFDPKSAYQRWKLESVPGEDGVYKLRAMGFENENYYLDVIGAVDTQGANLALYPSNYTSAQKFKIVKKQDNTFAIMTGTTTYGKCLDGQLWIGNTISMSYPVKQAECNQNSLPEGMRWYFFEQPSATSQRISTSSTYTPNKNFTASTTDQRGNSTLYSYDQTKGFLNETTDALGRKTSYTYNENNNTLMSVSAGGMTNSYTYDMGERLSEINVNNAVKYKFEYDGFGKATKTQVGNGTTYKTLSELSYNPNNLLSNQTYGNGHSVRFSYDNLDRITKKMYNDDENKKITYAYNSDGNLASTSDYFTNTRTKYIYDLADRIVSQREYTGTNGSNQIKSSTDYAYADKTNYLTGVKHFSPLGTQNIGYRYGNISNGEMPDQIYGVTWNGKEKQNYTYDGLGRLTNKKIICHSEPVEASQQIVLNNQYTYEDVANSNKTTTLVKSVTNAVGTCTYTYDLVGNIKTISDGTYTTSYDYDALNQLVRENNQKENYTKTFEYSNGNITSKKTYVYTLGALSGTPTVETFAYGDAEWKDLLTSFNGKNITYDAIGNPTKIGTDVLSWQGRQLMSYGTNSYEYNADGQRTSKTVGGVKTEFFYNGSILAGQKCGNDTLTFMYDNNGDAFGFTYNGTEYYYIKNAQNDVTAITDNMGIVIAKYTYDTWGKVINSEDLNLLPNSILISEINPIRYRSYYYDSELYIYYLNTRYYSPLMCRFLNADDTNVLDADQDSLVENNLFAYCLNNPVNHNDSDGKIARTLKRGLALGIFAVGFAVGWKVAAVATVVVGIAVVIGATVSYVKNKAPNGRPGIKGQGREGLEKKKGKKWKNKSGKRRPTAPKKHTPGKDHRKY